MAGHQKTKGSFAIQKVKKALAAILLRGANIVEIESGGLAIATHQIQCVTNTLSGRPHYLSFRHE